MPAKRVLRLSVPQRPTRYFAIVSSANDYRLCWEMNNAFGMHLTAAEPFVIQLANGSEASFQKYVHEAENWTCSLTVNRNTCGILIPHLSQTDYILSTDAPETEVTSTDILSHIRTLSSVTFAAEITDTSKLVKAFRKTQSSF